MSIDTTLDATHYFPTLPAGTAQIPAEFVEGSEAATTTTLGTVEQGAAVADGAVPFADLTAASNKVNELLASLRAAGIIAT